MAQWAQWTCQGSWAHVWSSSLNMDLYMFLLQVLQMRLQNETVFIYLFWPCLGHSGSSQARASTPARAAPEPLQWQCRILHLLCHKGGSFIFSTLLITMQYNAILASGIRLIANLRLKSPTSCFPTHIVDSYEGLWENKKTWHHREGGSRLMTSGSVALVHKQSPCAYVIGHQTSAEVEIGCCTQSLSPSHKSFHSYPHHDSLTQVWKS